MRTRDFDLLVLFGALALTLPFHGHWIDYELARRGVLALLSAAALIQLAVGGRAADLGPLRWFAGLVAWFALGALLQAGNPLEAWLRVAHWAALFGLAWWARGRSFQPLARSVVCAALPTAILVLAHRAGLDWPRGAGSEDPTGLLGNTGTASAFLAVAFGFGLGLCFGPASASGRSKLAWLVSCCLLGLAIGLTGSRGGVLAAGLAWVVCLPRERSGAMILRAIAPALLLGLGLLFAPDRSEADPATPEAPAVEPATEETWMQSSTDERTIGVRQALWLSSLDLVGEEPLFGQGPGQFRREYPRVRSQEEIEASTFGRLREVEAVTAHNDAIEVAVEGGLPALLWFVIGVLALAHGALRHSGRMSLGGLAALLGAGLTRTAFVNAPAAALALAGTSAAADTASAPLSLARRCGVGVLAVLLGAAGLSISIAAWSAANYTAGTSNEAALETAVAWHPSEANYRTMRLVETHGIAPDGTLQNRGGALPDSSREDLAFLAQAMPHHRMGARFSAELLAGLGRREEALARLQDVLRFDPGAPRAIQLRAILLCLDGRAETALTELLEVRSPAFDRAALLEQLTAIDTLTEEQKQLFLLTARRLAAARAFTSAPGARDTDLAISRLEQFAGRADPFANILRAAFTLKSPERNPRLATLMAPRTPMELSESELSQLRAAIAVLRTDAAWAKVLPD